MAPSAPARRLLEQACERFRKDIAPEDDQIFQSTKLDDVRVAIGQIEQQMAARLSLRNLERLKPFLDAMDRYSDVMATLCNGTPILPYVWAPIKFVIRTVHDQTNALDKMLSAYGHIGTSLPRFSRYDETFKDDHGVQQLLAFLYEDIMEFHRRSYGLVKRSAWRMFFATAWGRFDHHFGTLLNNISYTSDLLDKEVVSIDISQAKEFRLKGLDDSLLRERRWVADQVEAVRKWLQARDADQDLKLEWIRSHRHESTSEWIISNKKFRGWLQRGRGNPVMWLYGKPGSGKSMICAQVISFLKSDPNRKVVFFFCDFNTTGYLVTAEVLRTICAQMLTMDDELAPFIYDEYIVKGITPSVDVLKVVVSRFLSAFSDIRIVVDGVDELDSSEHRTFLNNIISITALNPNCKLLIASQEIGSISAILAKKTTMSIGEEQVNIKKDIAAIVAAALRDINERNGNILDPRSIEDASNKIISKADGMFLWVRLVLELLEYPSNVQDLRDKIDCLPTDLATAYGKLLDNILQRCSSDDINRIRRLFGWMIMTKGRAPLKKHELQLAVTLHPGMDCITLSTRPFPNSLDIGKPFIEEGPNETVRFIHSTVPQYLLDACSGPFVIPVISHHDIAFACISQMIQSLKFLNPGPGPLFAAGADVCNGLFGLHPYAQEYWVDHLLEFAERIGGLEQPQVSMLRYQAERLVENHTICLENELVPSRSFPDFVDARLDALQTTPAVHQLVLEILSFRRALEEKQAESSIEASAVETDTTLFSRVDLLYRTVVELVLTTPEQYPEMDYIKFKRQYGTSAYVCGIRGCARALSGFSNRELLSEHEQSHGKALICPEPGCAYSSDVGFPSLKSLKAHQSRHVQGITLRRMPKGIKQVKAGGAYNGEPSGVRTRSPVEVSMKMRKQQPRQLQQPQPQLQELQQPAAVSMKPSMSGPGLAVAAQQWKLDVAGEQLGNIDTRLTEMLANLTPEQRQSVSNLPPEKLWGLLGKWQEHQPRNAQIAQAMKNQQGQLIGQQSTGQPNPTNPPATLAKWRLVLE